jgi:hypothetical protein
MSAVRASILAIRARTIAAGRRRDGFAAVVG